MQQVTQRLRLQAPVKRPQPSVTEEYCQIIMLSNSDYEADAEMHELIKSCGGRMV